MFLKSPIPRDGCIKAESSQNCLYILLHLEADDNIIFGKDFCSNFMPARGRNIGCVKQKVIQVNYQRISSPLLDEEIFLINYNAFTYDS
uniref:Uncharacterized protein n=1 Tax=Romanomermis culicivorax TaxID=13658 RepID=A0A915IB22_ROMCU